MSEFELVDAGYRETAPHPGATARLVIAGTSDLHGFVRSWDYDTDQPDSEVGLAKVATLVAALRRRHGTDAVVLLDAGDTIQGTAMMRLAADGRLPAGPHPMALAMRELGYAAAALGNHDVEYGFDVLDDYMSTCGFPVLAANTTGPRALPASILLTVQSRRLDRPVAEQPTVRPVRLGVIGLTTPGIAVWTKGIVAGRLDVGDLVTAATTQARALLAAGAELIVVTAHSGSCPFSSYGDVVPWLENAAALVAEHVPGVVAVLAGHAHRDIAEQRITRPDGTVAVLTEPACYGRRLSVVEVDLVESGGRWQSLAASAQTIDPVSATEHPDLVAVIEAAHGATRASLAEPVGTLSESLDLSRPPWSPSPGLELIAAVAGEAAITAIDPSELASATAVAVAVSKVYRGGVLPAGQVELGAVGAIYRFDNRVVAIRLNGAQIRDYLNWSARYFTAATDPATDPATIARNVVPDAPQGLPDYDFDVIVGAGCLIVYDLDVSAPIGDRIRGLRVDGRLLGDEDPVVVVLTEYRHHGSRAYPHVRDAEVLWHSDRYLRELLEEHIRRVGLVDVAALRRPSWRLTVGNEVLPGTVAPERG